MWNALTWRRLRDTRIAEEVEALREETLRLVLWMTAAGYILWHSAATAVAMPNVAIRYWLLFPVVVAGLALTYLLSKQRTTIATACFSISSILSVTAAIWILRSPVPTLLYPFVVLAAAFLIDPLAGLVVTLGSFLLLRALWQFGPLAFLASDRVIEAGIASLIAVVVAWALGRNMIIAVEWSLNSYAQASRSAQAAQHHRAELVRALAQLDSAYYRLERANAALELAWKAAEAAERSKAEFVTNISHELRTPLNLIVGFSELIVTSPESYDVPLPSTYRGDLNAIYRSAQHLLTLTEDVLDLARVGMGRLALMRESVNLRQIADDASSMLHEYVTAKGLWLRVEAPDDLPLLSLDRVRIRQVLLNLLTNAARFTDRGGITISLSVQEMERVVVKVTDTGGGIQPKSLPKVFDAYYHVDAEKRHRGDGFEGVGLGLPLSKQLVELHGGQIGVESTVGLGSTFWFSLPLVSVEGTSHGGSWHPLRLVDGAGASSRLVVLAGAGSELAQFLQGHLRGYQVVAAADLAEATAIAVDSRAMAILADVDLADRVDDLDVPVPIFRFALPHPERMASVLGVTAYLVKPVTRAKLHDVVDRLGIQVRTALVVDDDPRFARLMARFLRSFPGQNGVETLLAQNGREALRLMEATRPDLLLLDLVMPELDGRDVLAAIAETPRLANVPVIVVSAQEEKQVVLHGPLSVTRSEGFHFEELLGAVEAVLGVLEPPRRYLTNHLVGMSPR